MRKRLFRKPSQPSLFRAPRATKIVENSGAAVEPKIGGNRLDGGLIIYGDGGCVPNPGQAGWAFVAYLDGQEIAHDFGGIDVATNNVAELTALLRAVEWVSENGAGDYATVISDSRYVVDGCNTWRHSWKAKGWKRKGSDAKPANQAIANLDLWQAIDAALTGNPLISIAWCKGHSGIAGNIRADELASIGRASLVTNDDSFSLALDREYRAIMGEPA